MVRAIIIKKKSETLRFIFVFLFLSLALCKSKSFQTFAFFFYWSLNYFLWSFLANIFILKMDDKLILVEMTQFWSNENTYIRHTGVIGMEIDWTLEIIWPWYLFAVFHLFIDVFFILLGKEKYEFLNVLIL